MLEQALFDWFQRESLAAPTLALAAFLFFVMQLAQGWAARGAILHLLGVSGRVVFYTLVFIGMVFGGYFFLTQAATTFAPVLTFIMEGGTAGKLHREDVRVNWGNGINQSELRVNHTRQEELVNEISQGKDKPVLYQKYTLTRTVDQESIQAFHGVVTLLLQNPADATFLADAVYEYQVANLSEFQTQAHFEFSLPAGGQIFENIAVTQDQQPVDWLIEAGKIVWDAEMQPGQESQIWIAYVARGARSFEYHVPSRAITNFDLQIQTNTTQMSYSFRPSGSGIAMTNHANDLGGYSLGWKIDHAILAPLASVYLKKPPITILNVQILSLLGYAGRALAVFLSLLMVTLLICGVQPKLWQFALLAGVYLIHYLGVSLLYPAVASEWGSMLLIAPLSLGLGFLVLRNLPPLARTLALTWLALFLLGYPFASLLPGERERNAVDGAMQAILILYVFGLTFYTRVRSARA